MESLLKARNYIEQYAELIGTTVATTDNYNYLLKLPDGTQYDVIIKNKDNIAWYNSVLFKETFGSISAFLQRLLGNYRIASLLSIGPVLYGYHIVDETVLVLILQHLLHPMDYRVITDNHEAITNWLEKIHSVGIYHGNLQTYNLRTDEDSALRMTDFDTMFYRDEKDLAIVVEWINRIVPQDVDQFIKQEETRFTDISS